MTGSGKTEKKNFPLLDLGLSVTVTSYNEHTYTHEIILVHMLFYLSHSPPGEIALSSNLA